MKTYRGYRDHDGMGYNAAVWVKGDGERNVRKLEPRLDLFNHSPSGFEWGYRGSGPAQLALAILADVLEDDDRAVRLHQQFKEDVIARLEHFGFSIGEDVVRRWVDDRGRTFTTEEA